MITNFGAHSVHIPSFLSNLRSPHGKTVDTLFETHIPSTQTRTLPHPLSSIVLRSNRLQGQTRQNRSVLAAWSKCLAIATPSGPRFISLFACPRYIPSSKDACWKRHARQHRESRLLMSHRSIKTRSRTWNLSRGKTLRPHTQHPLHPSCTKTEPSRSPRHPQPPITPLPTPPIPSDLQSPSCKALSSPCSLHPSPGLKTHSPTRLQSRARLPPPLSSHPFPSLPPSHPPPSLANLHTPTVTPSTRHSHRRRHPAPPHSNQNPHVRD